MPGAAKMSLPYAKPRSAGKLHVGSVIYRGGVFSVEMAFESATTQIGYDEMKSATLAATRHFLTLLAQNGFRDWDTPEVRVTDQEGRFCKFFIGCRASRKRPAPIIISTLKDDRKTNGKDDDEDAG